MAGVLREGGRLSSLNAEGCEHGRAHDTCRGPPSSCFLAATQRPRRARAMALGRRPDGAKTGRDRGSAGGAKG